MTKVFQNQSFHSFHGHFWQREYSNMVFRNCEFVGCSLGFPREPKKRQRLTHCKFYDIEQRGSTLNGTIVEEVLVDGFKTNGLFQTWGAVFKHVTFRGKMGRIMLSPLLVVHPDKVKLQQAFIEANKTYYETVDWALDISEAEFAEADLRGVPGHLIRRDPETQVLIWREKAILETWRKLNLTRTYWPTALEFFLKSGAESIVLVAPKSDREFNELLEGLNMLREAGVAEQD